MSSQSRSGCESGQGRGCRQERYLECVGGASRQHLGLGRTRMGSGNSSVLRGKQPLGTPPVLLVPPDSLEKGMGASAYPRAGAGLQPCLGSPQWRKKPRLPRPCQGIYCRNRRGTECQVTPGQQCSGWQSPGCSPLPLTPPGWLGRVGMQGPLASRALPGDQQS